jgi:squalene-hopene/tetraprenyl-beta-curcumene cyclase
MNAHRNVRGPWIVAGLLAAGLATGWDQAARSAEPVTPENLVAPELNERDEPLAEQFSLEKAAHFLDSASLEWQKSRDCMTCHTNYAFLMARPAISADAPAHREVRAYAERLVTERWPASGPRWDAEVVMTGAILAFNDSATSGTLHPTTRQALDRMWTLQREDGGFNWIKCGWPPMESDDHFGATMAAIGAGAAPEGYAETPAAKAGLERLASYFRANPGPSLHHKAMILWGATYTPALMAEEDRKATVDALLALQKADGGWGLATLLDWQRRDKTPQDLESSDGYGTGFTVYVLRRAGIPAGDERLARGIAWLKANQRASGRWFTRSLFADSKHFITHAGTAFAVMALGECETAAVAASDGN